jgi:hypothetical protein
MNNDIRGERTAKENKRVSNVWEQPIWEPFKRR